MGAADIVGRCLDEGIDIIAIADHNAAANSVAVISSQGKPLTVLPALEVQSREDIHTLCLLKLSRRLLLSGWVWHDWLR